MLRKYLFLFIGMAVMAAGCSKAQKEPHARYDIVPLPVKITEKEGNFALENGTEICIPAQNEALKKIAEMFIQQIRTASGLELKIKEITGSETPQKGIVFTVSKIDEIGAEGYKLWVEKGKIDIQANQPNGFFYAIQTLFQMLPPEVYSKEKVKNNPDWSIACAEITDFPRFQYRGMHLDVARHLFPVEFIKKYIDLLAMQKMNRFHWHLTDDQGWRIQIDKYPKLNEIGSWRNGTLIGHYNDTFPQQFDNVRYGGFYTKAEAKEIVAYAASKYIEVIPEIEMPGHAVAAIAAYPELCCRKDTVFEVGKTFGVYDDVFCTTDTVFTFLEDVLTEVMEIFPSQYIHIGGDECPKNNWRKCKHCQSMIKTHKLKDEHELQSYFIHRIEAFVNSKGKKIIGWDEILEGGLAPNATVMSWRGDEEGVKAAMQDHDVIMTPTSFCYLNYYQADPQTEPLAIGGFVPTQKVYSYNPMPENLPADKQKYIIGVQANLWTEYIKDSKLVEYMLYPRASAIAEIAWTPNERKNWDSFTKRMLTQFKRYDYLGVTYAKHFFDVKASSEYNTQKADVEIKFETLFPDTKIYYTTDGTEPTVNSKLYTGPFGIKEKTMVKAATFKDGKKVGNVYKKEFYVFKSTGMKYTLVNEPKTYLGTTKYSLTDGIMANLKSPDTWIGFSGKDLDIIIDLTKEQSIKRIAANFESAVDSWIFQPTEIEVFISPDGKTFTSVSKQVLGADKNTVPKIIPFEVLLNNASTRFIKVMAKNQGICPKGHPGEGNPAWLFVDEIVVE